MGAESAFSVRFTPKPLFKFLTIGLRCDKVKLWNQDTSMPWHHNDSTPWCCDVLTMWCRNTQTMWRHYTDIFSKIMPWPHCADSLVELPYYVRATGSSCWTLGDISAGDSNHLSPFPSLKMKKPMMPKKHFLMLSVASRRFFPFSA